MAGSQQSSVAASANVLIASGTSTDMTGGSIQTRAAVTNTEFGGAISFLTADGSLTAPFTDVLRDQILWQVGALDALCRGYNRRVQYIKPHGALYHAVMEGGAQAHAVYEASQILKLPLLLP